MNPNTVATPPTEPLRPEEFDEMDAILDELRLRFDETPQWEFCEGFMAALIVSRRAIAVQEYLPVLLDSEVDDGDAAHYRRFMALWQRRWDEIAHALAIEVQSLDDERAFHPEVMDVRGAVAGLPEAERAEMAAHDLPSFAQVWALGFMYVVENWPDEWQPPRDKEARKVLDEALHCMVALTEDDQGEATLNVFDDAGPPTVSVQRFNAFADAVWAVYDLHALWRSMGPRVETVRKQATPGRNDICFCGSGKKFKKCHGT